MGRDRRDAHPPDVVGDAVPQDARAPAAGARPPRIRIASVSADRSEDVVALWHAAGLTRPWNDPHADLVRALAGPHSTVLAAQDDEGLLLGTAMVGHDGNRGWVYYLAVQPALQRRGLGRQLMRACEQWLRERGVPKVNLMVRTTNTTVLGFYADQGYQDIEVVVLGKFLEE